MSNILTIQKLGYSYGKSRKAVLKDVNVAFDVGQLYVIVGKSGSGKSTLLSLIAGLDLPKSGRIMVGSESLQSLDRDKYRANQIGVIFQGFNLLNTLTGIQNIVLSMNVSHSAEINKKQYAQDLLSSIGIDEETANRTVLQLSGGEQQRVAIARALAHHPEIIIADEPTANLDKETEDEILQIFSNLAHQENKCVIIVSHSNRVAAVADQIFRIQNGTVISKITEN